MEKISVESQRLVISSRSEEEMMALYSEESEPEMKQAYFEMLDTMKAAPEHGEWGCEWAIVLKEGGLIGGICFKGMPDAKGEVEVGYGIEDSYQHQGYATEAVGAMLKWALEQENVLCVSAQTDLKNIISQRVLIRNGFIRDGYGDEGPRFVYRK